MYRHFYRKSWTKRFRIYLLFTIVLITLASIIKSLCLHILDITISFFQLQILDFHKCYLVKYTYNFQYSQIDYSRLLFLCVISNNLLPLSKIMYILLSFKSVQYVQKDLSPSKSSHQDRLWEREELIAWGEDHYLLSIRVAVSWFVRYLILSHLQRLVYVYMRLLSFALYLGIILPPPQSQCWEQSNAAKSSFLKLFGVFCTKFLSVLIPLTPTMFNTS